MLIKEKKMLKTDNWTQNNINKYDTTIFLLFTYIYIFCSQAFLFSSALTRTDLNDAYHSSATICKNRPLPFLYHSPLQLSHRQPFVSVTHLASQVANLKLACVDVAFSTSHVPASALLS